MIQARLQELRRRYASCAGPALVHTQWSAEYVRMEVDLQRFRADGAYVWQDRDGNGASAYEATTRYLLEMDRASLFDRLREDDAFGATAVRLACGRVVSRDLLDSVCEIYSLDRIWNILAMKPLTVVDIGAGYGRFAHRLVCAHWQCEVYCVDSIPESTAISEYYLAYRGVSARARVVPFDELDALRQRARPDLAVNMHSFSECSRDAIAWWIDLLARWRVPRLLIVPNRCSHDGVRLLSREREQRLDYTPLLLAAGYRLKAVQPKYLEPWLQAHGVSPTHYHYYELQ